VGALIFSSLAVFVLIRFGLLALAVNLVVVNIVQTFPLTAQGSAWYAGISLTGILLIAAMAFYGFYTSGGAGRFSGLPCTRGSRRTTIRAQAIHPAGTGLLQLQGLGMDRHRTGTTIAMCLILDRNSVPLVSKLPPHP
jgi:hypothetical protein